MPSVPWLPAWLPAAHDAGNRDALVLVTDIGPSTGEGTAPGPDPAVCQPEKPYVPSGDVARARKSGLVRLGCRAEVAAAWWCGWRISLLAGARETGAGCPFRKPALPWHPSPLKSLAPGS